MFVVAVVTFAIAYLSILLIEIIKNLKTTSIQLVAGLSIGQIVWEGLFKELLLIYGIMLIGMLLGLIIQLTINLFEILFILMVIWTSLLYGSILFILAIILYCLYFTIDYNDQIIKLIKGQLPFKFLLTIMQCGQIVAMFLVGWTLDQGIKYQGLLYELKRSEQAWLQRPEYYQLSFSLTAFQGNPEQIQDQYASWYPFIAKAFQNNDLLFINHNLNHQLNSNQNLSDFLNDSSPSGKVIYVSPNYLELEEIDMSDKLRQQAKQLDLGEYLVLIPDKFKDTKEEIEHLLQDYLMTFSRVGLELNSSELYNLKLFSEIISSGNLRFLYNTDKNTHIQFLKDPIIVLMTPESTGNSLPAQMYWAINAGGSLYYKDYYSLLDGLKSFNLYKYVSYIISSLQQYFFTVSRCIPTFRSI